MSDASEAAVVPAVGTAGSLSVVRSLGRRGIDTIVVSEHESPPTFYSRYCSKTEHVPSPNTDFPGYRDALLALAKRPAVRTIIPVREPDIYALATAREEFAAQLRTPWPSAEQLECVHDRLRLFETAIAAGVAVPDTALLDEVDDWDRERIVKGRYALLSSETSGTVPPGELHSPPKTLFLEPGREPDLDAIVDQMKHVPIAQDYVSGSEYCFRGLYRDGEAVATSQKKLIRGIKYSRGPSVYHQAVAIPDLEDAGRALLDELDWEGMASVGFIRDGAGEFKLLEVNPRIPSSLPMDIHAGVDYPACLRQLATGQPVNHHRAEYTPGVASHLLRGELVHLHSVLTETNPLADRPSGPETVWNIASSILTQPHFDYLSLDDPVPFVRDWIDLGKKFLPR